MGETEDAGKKKKRRDQLPSEVEGGLRGRGT